MGRFPVAAAVFILASMMAISAAHAGRAIDQEGAWPEYGLGSALVGSNGELSVKAAAGAGPTAPAAKEPEQVFEFGHRKVFDHDLNCFKKVPITGF